VGLGALVTHCIIHHFSEILGVQYVIVHIYKEPEMSYLPKLKLKLNLLYSPVMSVETLPFPPAINMHVKCIFCDCDHFCLDIVKTLLSCFVTL